MKLSLLKNSILLLIVLIFLLIGCLDKPNHDQKILDELQSVRTELQALKEQLNESHDSNSDVHLDTLQSHLPLKDSVRKEEVKKTEFKTTETLPSKPQPSQSPTQEETITRPGTKEELYYYKSHKKVSLRITPWVEGRRKLIFYDQNGDITNTQEDVHLSYQEISEIKEIHDNGAISKILINNNPGASRYWSDCVITFNQDNEPETKTITTYPMETISQNMDNVYLYDKTQKSWVLKKFP